MSIAVAVLLSSVASVCADLCSVGLPCRCTTLQGPLHLLDVTCRFLDIPDDLPPTTAVLTLMGLSRLTHKRFNQSLVHLKRLTLSDGILSEIIAKDSFEGFENVNKLVIHRMSLLRKINKYAFQILKKLTSIVFDSIYKMDILSIFNSLVCANKQTLREITIICDDDNVLDAQVLDDDVYKTMEFFHITHVSIISCGVAVIKVGFLRIFRDLQYLNLSYNYISGDKRSLQIAMFLPKLKILDVSEQHAPSNKKVSNNFQRRRLCVTIPEQITYISARGSGANLNWIKIDCIHKITNLTYLDISGNYLFRIIYRFKGFYSLKYLHMESLHLSSFPLDLFHDLPMIKHIAIGHNNIKRIIENDDNGEIFSNNKRLISLDLSYCSINTLPDEFMYSLRGIENLNLAGNRFRMINITHLNRLKMLNISSNKFESLGAPFMQSFDKLYRNHNITVDVSNNPISSTRSCCDVLDFIRLLDSRKIVFYNLEKYKCINGNGIMWFPSISLNELEISCNSSGSLRIILITGSVLGFLAISILAVMYRKRWCIRAYILAGKRYLKENDHYDLSEYCFDAFVAYHEEDSLWVRTVIIESLENINGLKLCIHERDFTPGEPIEENISRAIESSRRVILVVSPSFVTSHWCLLEMRLARQVSLERGRDILIPVILQHIGGSKGDRTLFNILNQNTYLEWPRDNAEGQELFINRLVGSIKSKINHPDDI